MLEIGVSALLEALGNRSKRMNGGGDNKFLPWPHPLSLDRTFVAFAP